MVAAPGRGDDDGSFYQTLVMTDSAGHADALAPLELGESAQALAPKSNTGRPARTVRLDRGGRHELALRSAAHHGLDLHYGSEPQPCGKSRGLRKEL